MDQDTPTYNLKVVVQETGIKADTLRAWERRYGLPDPERSQGGHRLYSQRDIDTLVWLMARQDEGMSISRAVDLWRRLEDEGTDPLHGRNVVSREQAPPIPISGDEIERYRELWINACLAFDEQAAERVLSQALALYPLELVAIQILQQAVAELGARWYQGTVTVQQEHFATALAMRRIDVMLGTTPPSNRPGRILTAAPAGEEHVFVQSLLTLLLRRRGWGTVYLGANVPLDRMQQSVERVRPQLAIFTAQRLQSATTLRMMAQAVQARHVAVAYGGRIFNQIPRLRDVMPGHFLGESIPEALERVEALMPNPPLVAAPTQPSGGSQEMLSHFQARVPAIEAEMVRRLAANGNGLERLRRLELDLSQDSASALALGDVSLAANNFAWLYQRFAGEAEQQQFLQSYLATYCTTIEELLQPGGASILQAFQPYLPPTSTQRGAGA